MPAIWAESGVVPTPSEVDRRDRRAVARVSPPVDGHCARSIHAGRVGAAAALAAATLVARTSRTGISARMGRALRPLSCAPAPRRRVVGARGVASGRRVRRCRWSQKLRRAYPHVAIVLTHMTATGRETGRALYGDTVTAGVAARTTCPFAVEAFLDAFPSGCRISARNRAVAQPDRFRRRATRPALSGQCAPVGAFGRGLPALCRADPADARARWPASPRSPAADEARLAALGARGTW